MKKTILTTTLFTLTTLLLSGCAEHSFIEKRFENKTQINMTLEQALNNVKYIESDQKDIFNNNKNEVTNVIDNKIVKTCTTIQNDTFFKQLQQKELKNKRLEPLMDSKYDYNILVGQFARLRYCHDKTQEIREKELVVETKTYEKINKDCKLAFEEQKESDITKAKQNNEFMEMGYIEYKNNIYVPNVNPLNPKNFFNYKIYSDNLTGTITLELEYKDYKNRSVKYFLYEELTTCEFSTRSKKEVIEENEKKIKIQKENFKRTGKMY